MIEGLENEADEAAAIGGKGVSRPVCRSPTADNDVAGWGRSQTTQQIEQGAFAGTRRPHNGLERALLDGHIDAGQGVDHRRPHLERLAQVGGGDERCGLGRLCRGGGRRFRLEIRPPWGLWPGRSS